MVKRYNFTAKDISPKSYPPTVRGSEGGGGGTGGGDLPYSGGKGALAVFNGVTWDVLEPSTSGYFLRTQGVGNLPEYVALTGGGDMLAANNLDDVANAATSRTNLGLAIGTDVQAFHSSLGSIAGLTTAADRMIYTTALNTYAVSTLSAFGRTLIDDADAATARTTLDITKANIGLGNVTDNAQVIAPATNTENSIPQWSGTDNKTLKDGLAIGTAASNLVQLDGDAKLPAVDGSQLLNLPAGFSNPMTTLDDVIIGGTGGVAQRLERGAEDTIIGVSGGSVGYHFTIGTAASNLVQLDGMAKLPAVDGSQLTNLPSGFSNPMTTLDDIIIGGTGGIGQRLEKGAEHTIIGVMGGSVGYNYTVGTSSTDLVQRPAENAVGADTISENTAAAGITVDGTLVKDGTITIIEPAADHTATGLIDSGTAGEAIVFGDLLYMKSDGKWWKSDADAAATMPGMRLALESAAAEATCSLLSYGRARDDTWTWTVGGLVYASTDAGGLTQTRPSGTTDQIQVIGLAYHADYILFQPSPVLGEVT